MYDVQRHEHAPQRDVHGVRGLRHDDGVLVMTGIINDVPIPELDQRPPTLYPFAELDVGQMFFAEGKTTAYMSSYAAKVGKKLGRRFKTRTISIREDKKKGLVICESDHPKATDGVGVWRIA